jgi:hypothetical protein
MESRDPLNLLKEEKRRKDLHCPFLGTIPSNHPHQICNGILLLSIWAERRVASS